MWYWGSEREYNFLSETTVSLQLLSTTPPLCFSLQLAESLPGSQLPTPVRESGRQSLFFLIYSLWFPSLWGRPPAGASPSALFLYPGVYVHPYGKPTFLPILQTVSDFPTSIPLPCLSVNSQYLGRNKYRDSQLVSIQRVEELESLSPKWDVSVKSFSLGLREPCRRGCRETVRSRGDGGCQENKAF